MNTDNPPAFARPASVFTEDSTLHQTGMSLRDWFAGQALVGMMAQPEQPAFRFMAEEAYQSADAMLKARGTTNEPT